MEARLTRTDVEAARADLNNRTLSQMGLKFGRLLYLASLRDHNSGRYYHDGLAFQFSEEAAGRAVAEAHKEEFLNLARGSLEDFVNELRLYLQLVTAEPQETIRLWERLEPYRVAIPADCDPLTAGHFLANIKVALAIVATTEPPQHVTR